MDDMISVEPSELADSGRFTFIELCMLLGWAISMEKSPLVLSAVPDGEAAIRVTAKRIEQLPAILTKIKVSNRLGSGEPASLTGNLGFTLCV